uniref:DNA repair protein n=1 Tax=Piscinibacter defluvii TaxID=1796922 RepID=UPI001F0C5115|nr:DNA repair protein [Piscinibacter defluvii]
MPSRAGADGLGAFSYYDHVFLPESTKELVWRHGGKRYKSQLVLRVNGKKKTEAFLFEHCGPGWAPVVLRDGNVSDGKVETYEKAVAEILCPADTFFTSVFSAQGKRPLSAFKNAEIKTLLADLLGLEQVRQQGALAADVVKQLKAGLAVVRQGLARAQEDAAVTRRSLAELDGASQALLAATAQRTSTAARLDAARQKLATVTAERTGAAETEARRRALADEARRAKEEHDSAAQRLSQELPRLQQRETSLQQRIAERCHAHGRRRAQLVKDIAVLTTVAQLRESVERAAARRDFARRVVARCQAIVGRRQASVDVLEKAKATLVARRREVESIDREAGQIALRQADLQRRFGLTSHVPCAGMEIQGQCQLLGDAREAKALLPSADAALTGLAEKKRVALQEIADTETAVRALPAEAQLRNQAEQMLETADQRLRDIELLCARRDEVTRAAQTIDGHTAELATLPEQAAPETGDERAERADIAAARTRVQDELSRVAVVRDEALTRTAEQVALLPPPLDAAGLNTARQEVEAATQAAAAAEAAESCARQRDERAKALGEQLADIAAKEGAAIRAAKRVEDELATWSLLAKCLSNDGVIALDIDDAGPTFSALANELLLACYGPRFTLQVITQSTNGKGELREDFDIIVHDGTRDESKSLKLVSGGERVWISCRSRHEIHHAENPDMPSLRSGRRPGRCNCAAGTCEATRHNAADSGTIGANSRGGTSLSLMSGGERTFIDACLTRAVALYLAQNTGRRFDTLFTDEADGPLDPEHKRMFMAMKREVLRLGGYRQEFFITQTPHLAAMADAIIDLDAMQAEPRADIDAAHR